MPNVNELKKSKFLKQQDVEPAILCTISGYEQVSVAQEGAEPEMKYALMFNEVEKPLVLNSTNGQIIAAFTGSGEFDDWIGKQVVLYFDPNVSFGGKLTGGIRCRAPKKPAAAPAAQLKPASAPAPETDFDIPF